MEKWSDGVMEGNKGCFVREESQELCIVILTILVVE